MNRFKKLSSIVFLLLAFIYPPAMAEAKDIGTSDWVEKGLNTQLIEPGVESETNVVGGGESGELLLAHRRYRRHYYRRSRHRRHYYRRRNRHRRYYGQYYRHGRWQRVRDRHGRYIYHWRRY
ncbi:hypothetical protein [Anabaena sp. UHCC 0399]|uniref:hypothetical protein n=1 Tax=Anabaena sp. UHCC 0399 TaxID=3110238 RepID=UPI002B1E9E1E|nr:hypothetical protein [Anabaena sp. UHCC 0399]MEA5564706.1 hypothetical protein [Anabaena sp. UHCC 0399]